MPQGQDHGKDLCQVAIMGESMPPPRRSGTPARTTRLEPGPLGTRAKTNTIEV